MGKIRFKLSHVMPHVWFYKLKKVGRPGERHAYTSSESKPASSKKAIYTSPVNHKAIDIPFPVETPKRSPLIQPPLTFPEDIAPFGPPDSVGTIAHHSPLPALPRSLSHRLDHTSMTNSAEISHFTGFSSAPMSKSGVASIDVSELERRLRALESEDRRKYYISPMFSVALPSPILDGTHAAASHHESFDMQDYSSDGEDRRFPSKVVYKEGKPFDGGSGGGVGLYRSSNESNSLRQSSSASSDTGFERASSSVWERDVFSITSDGSEAFTTIIDDVDSNPMLHRSSRQRYRKLKELRVNTKQNTKQNSPLLYGSSPDLATIHTDISTGFYAHRRDFPAVQNDMMMNGFYGNNHDTEAIQNDTSHNRDMNAEAHGDIGTSVWSNYKSNDRPSSKASPTSKSVDSQQGRKTVDHLPNKYRAAVPEGKQPPLLDSEESKQLPLVQYESSDDQKSQHRRASLGEFSYTRCKERLLLSGRTSIDGCNDSASSEIESETMSNYTKFKLKQKINIHSKMSTIESMSPDPGLYNKVSSSKQSNHNMDQGAYANARPLRLDLVGNPAQSKGSSRRSSIVNQSRSPYQKGIMGEVNSNTAYDQGPSWFKATLRAVREKTRDPSFQQFSTKSGAAHRCRVFDSFAMVKCSYDPKQDFKESMVEMIVEKDLHSSHDMVELLQCYLTLNSDKYHDTIVKVFTEVWSEAFQRI